MPTTAFSLIESSLTSRLGQIAIDWAVIEEWLGHLLANMIDADPGGMHIITNEMSASTVIQAIQTVLSVYEPKNAELKEVRELIEEADELRKDRNALVHGIWHSQNCEPGSAMVSTTRWKGVEIIHEWLITTADLDQLLDDFSHWLERFVALGIRFNFPRRHGELKSVFAED